jgi:Fe(3+) dicitrate transport protein
MRYDGWWVAIGLLATSSVQAQEVAASTVPLEAVTVVGAPDRADQLPGSVTVIDQTELELNRVFTTAEALRAAPGVHVRDEEGFGLRPNIGIRGLNPTRSTKLLLLEDGIPFAYAPYGDNSSYYHPPVDRFDRIELLTGPAVNAYGPQTLSAVINYITPNPPEAPGGGASVAFGNRDYLNAHGWIGGHGMLVDVVRKEGDGARDNMHSELNDLNFKGVRTYGDHRLIARANFYSEDSQLTYSGITDAERANFGSQYNPFRNDDFEIERFGASLSDEWTLGAAVLTSTLYYNRFSRDWWRQTSTTSDTQCGEAFRDARFAGQAVDPDACNSVQGRLRNYYTVGLEPRLRLPWGAHEFSGGVRAHVESQDRVQVNGTAPTARAGTLAESNKRGTDAYSAFVQNRFVFGDLAVTPGLRVENVRHERSNRLTGQSGKAHLTEVLPSLGLTYTLGEHYTLFGGAHKGFAPPRTEDVIAGNGTSVELDAEESTNLELGLRARPHPGLRAEATLFRNEFQRQIAVGSIAGGSTPLAQGEALYQGAELALRSELGAWLESSHSPFVQLAYTVVATARSETPFSCVVVSGSACPTVGAPIPGSAAGRRMPYAPRNLLTATLGYGHPAGFDARVEAQHIGEQFSDFANTEAPTPGGSGQIGRIAASTVWNLAANFRMPASGVGFFVAAKNLFDKDYIVDRTRGIQVGMPRLIEGGVEYKF